MKYLKTALVASVLTTAAGTTMADGAVIKDGYVFEQNKLIPTGARAEVGTTGYGGAIQWTASPYVGLSLGYNGGNISWRDDLSVNGTKYDVDMDNNNVYLNAEIHPWGTSDNRWAQGTYFAAGVAYLDNDYDLSQRSKDGNVKLNGTNYSYNGELRGQMNYKNNIAPYVGVGIAPKFGKNWGVFGEIGAYYTGNPTVNLDADGTFINAKGGSAEADLKAEQQKIANDDKYAWLPVGKVGVNFYW
ncbi:ornithine uptake porin CarO [Acinetobacter portensis]|uniref:Ornithine uptake porin CarO n=2 Tax=Acinetobacter TaxID=469 RepID=A0ABU5GGM2_9GAMM|nr:MULTISPECIES: ornithine uptake porin CarO [Acinetobacter]MCK7609983.1 ornithine uptake porin CarO [Acinetobacter portensis]MCK7640758.1 ornithine uptake porin CarO [Acinetobacter portensis]MDY6459206.1 ornithine uptake porin CarO [Acinetobacter faecalis]MDY6485287.1 ornithine uptake porin CarO [Acinetobacter faecalis]MDY6510823.1 ornithine uptake porin CarO [Acinetobacter faecalis]